MADNRIPLNEMAYQSPYGQNVLASRSGSNSGWGSFVNNFTNLPGKINSQVSSQVKSNASGVGSVISNDYAKESAARDAQIRALTAQLAAQPRLPQFDILANYNRAKSQATQYATPLYQQKLNLFLEGQGIKKTTKSKETDLARENNQISLDQTLGDNQTNLERTGEDLSTALAKVGQNTDEFLTDEAAQFDDARRGLQEDVAAAGSTDTGLGQQQIDRQLTDRNTTSERQLNEFQGQEEAKKLLATRTIDDIATGNVRAGTKKGQDDKATQIDFDSYMDSLANEEKQYRLQNDLDLALEIARQTQSYQQAGVNDFVAGLSGQGYRAQDIALAKQVYG